MKYCKNCGAENGDENKFCFNCRGESFGEVKLVSPPAPDPNMQNMPNMQNTPNMQGMPRPTMPPPPVYMQPRMPKKQLGLSDLFTILGFVCSIVGMFSISMILHPLGAIASIIGFVNGNRFKPLALAGAVISIVGGIVYIVISMYQNGLLPEWITFGAFH